MESMPAITKRTHTFRSELAVDILLQVSRGRVVNAAHKALQHRIQIRVLVDMLDGDRANDLVVVIGVVLHVEQRVLSGKGLKRVAHRLGPHILGLVLEFFGKLLLGSVQAQALLERVLTRLAHASPAGPDVVLPVRRGQELDNLEKR